MQLWIKKKKKGEKVVKTKAACKAVFTQRRLNAVYSGTPAEKLHG